MPQFASQTGQVQITAPLNCGISKCRWNACSRSQHRDSYVNGDSHFSFPNYHIIAIQIIDLDLPFPFLPTIQCFILNIFQTSLHFFLQYFYKLHEKERDYLDKLDRRCRVYIHRDTCTRNCPAYSRKCRCRDYRP